MKQIIDKPLFRPQGMLFSAPETVKTVPEMVRLWMHEAARVYKDKLVDEGDIASYNKVMKDSIKKAFEVRDHLMYYFAKIF